MTSRSPLDAAAKPGRDLFLISALFLFLELAFIRWLPAQILFLTFFTNTVLLASFLGLALGCMAARHRFHLLATTPVLLTLCILTGTGMEWLRLRLQDIIDVGGNKVSPQVVYFGTEVRVSDVASFVIPIELVAGALFLLVAATMIGPGQVLGRRFASVTDPVRAYSINIAGSLAGILAFSLCSTLLPPVWWFALAAAGLLYFLVRETPVRWWAAALCCLSPVLLIVPQWMGTGVIRERYPDEFWSPYYRINYSEKNKVIVVNLLGHQQMVSRNLPSPAYALPYALNRDAGQPPFRDILIIGAGSGNDVSRALLWAAPDTRIDAVEIDPVIQRLGVRDHPDRPYQDPRVARHLGDGRNFLRSTHKKYDLVVFALIDSLVLHSSVSNIRLESYMFTRESMADVQRCLKPDGLFVMYNYFRQGWIVSRLVKTVGTAFGTEPLTLTLPYTQRITADGKADGFTVLFAGPREQAIAKAFAQYGRYVLPSGPLLEPSSSNGFLNGDGQSSRRLAPAAVEVPADLRISEDVWPFLYLRNPMIPALSWRGTAVIGILSLALLWLFGWRTGPEHRSSLNIAMLLLGAGFMLLETKAVVHMALVFGSTWMVNTVVFAAIMVMILASNLWVEKKRPRVLTPYYFALLVTLALNIAIPLDNFLGLAPLLQGIAAAALVLSPVLFSGIVFATLIKTAEKSEQAIAYNAAGAILGGLAETASLLIGFQYLVGVAAVVYVLAWAFGSRAARMPRVLAHVESA